MMTGHSQSIDRRLIHHGRKFDLETVSVRKSDGRAIQREVVRHPGAVVIVPILPDGRLLMEWVVRPSIIGSAGAAGRGWGRDGKLLEFPAGTLEPPEPPQECARRELREETGYTASVMDFLGEFYTSPGIGDELMHAFVARELEAGEQALEEDEAIELEPVSVDRALAMLDSGELRDGKSIAALLWALRRGLVLAGTR